VTAFALRQAVGFNKTELWKVDQLLNVMHFACCVPAITAEFDFDSEPVCGDFAGSDTEWMPALKPLGEDGPAVIVATISRAKDFACSHTLGFVHRAR
jgi:hypothetical protein